MQTSSESRVTTKRGRGSCRSRETLNNSSAGIGKRTVQIMEYAIGGVPETKRLAVECDEVPNAFARAFLVQSEDFPVALE